MVKENGFGLWLDFRSTEDNSLHGSGRKLGKHKRWYSD